MIPEDRVLFACARQLMLEEHIQAVLGLNRQYRLSWDVIFAKAEYHGVAPAVYINLCQKLNSDLDIPPSTAELYHLLMLQNSILKEQRAQKLEQVLAYFSERSIEVMVFKGSVLDLLVYTNPAYVAPRDIDLILQCKQDEISGSERQAFMDYLHNTGIEYDFYKHHDITINGTLPIDFSQIWKDSRKMNFRGQTVSIMCPEDMLISLCVNSCRKRYFRLKSLMDIAETLRVIKGINWEFIAKKAIAYDCQNIVYTALLITSQTVGCELPVGGLERLQVNSFRSMVIRKVVGWMLRYKSLPDRWNIGITIRGRQVDSSLVLPYLTYRGYQIRYKLFHEIL